MLAEKPVFQVNLGLSNKIISCEPIPVHDRDSEGVVKRKCGRKLKHFAKDWIQVTRNVVIVVIDNFRVSKLNLYVWVRFSIEISRLKVNTLKMMNSLLQSLCQSVFISGHHSRGGKRLVPKFKGGGWKMQIQGGGAPHVKDR